MQIACRKEFRMLAMVPLFCKEKERLEFFFFFAIVNNPVRKMKKTKKIKINKYQNNKISS